MKYEWQHRNQKTYKGIGDARVTSYGKKEFECIVETTDNALIGGQLQSHEQDGSHPLLLSDASQAALGFVKDMSSNLIFLKNYDVYLEVCRAHDSGLKVINIEDMT